MSLVGAAAPAFDLRLFEDRLGPDARLRLAPAPRVFYVLTGEVDLGSEVGITRLSGDRAWHSSGACEVAAHADAALLRWELRPRASPLGALSGSTRLLLAAALALDPRGAYLIRCDRVDFLPGGEARPHRHRGGGIRYLLNGELELRVGESPARRVRRGEAWFESGDEPVHARAGAGSPASFVRVAVLPREIRGQPSIVYLNPGDAHVTPRRYTVWVDEPIELPAP